MSTIAGTVIDERDGRTFATVEDLERGLREEKYIADRGLATTLYLTLRLQKPLLLEGEPASARPRSPRSWPRSSTPR